MKQVKKIAQLQQAKSLASVAILLGYSPSTLSYIIYQIPDSKKYTEFTIPKKGGGIRLIQSPNNQLKEVQRRLSRLLQECLSDITADRTHGRSLSHGFRKNHSIVTNAWRHKNKRYVFNIDLRDFFPSLNFGRIRGFFIKSKYFRLHPKTATVIAQIACHDQKLPQGSPVSPVISNLIGHILDTQLAVFAKNNGCVYSRYADDITFSTRSKLFPRDIAERDIPTMWRPAMALMDMISPIWAEEFKRNISGQRFSKWKPGRALTKLIVESGFEINLKKVSMQYNTSRQMVTGLVVNNKVNIPQTYYRQLRSMCNAVFSTGVFYLGDEMKYGVPKGETPKIAGATAQLRGILSYIYHIKSQEDRRPLKERWDKPTAIHKLFQKYLYFEYFHALDRPLIICEGKTDIVHIKCAMKSLSTTFPEFVDTSDALPIWNVNFYKRSKLNVEVMQLTGGTGDFTYLIHYYKERISRYKCLGQAHPVILLADNDCGLESITKKVRKLFGKNINNGKPFHHLTNNLYLVVLPLFGNWNSVEIENFYHRQVRQTKLNGKTFHPEKKRV